MHDLPKIQFFGVCCGANLMQKTVIIVCVQEMGVWLINAIIIIYHHLVMIIWRRYCSVSLLPPGSLPGNEYINYTNLSNKRQPPVNQGSLGYMMLLMYKRIFISIVWRSHCNYVYYCHNFAVFYFNILCCRVGMDCVQMDILSNQKWDQTLIMIFPIMKLRVNSENFGSV